MASHAQARLVDVDGLPLLRERSTPTSSLFARSAYPINVQHDLARLVLFLAACVGFACLLQRLHGRDDGTNLSSVEQVPQLHELCLFGLDDEKDAADAGSGSTPLRR